MEKVGITFKKMHEAQAMRVTLWVFFVFRVVMMILFAWLIRRWFKINWGLMALILIVTGPIGFWTVFILTIVRASKREKHMQLFLEELEGGDAR